MKYFLDTEFLEGTQKKWFGETKPTIDLISIGIVAEDDKEYYAISKDFNLKEAWNRYDLVKNGFRDCGMTPNYKRVYWIRENVLKPIYLELKEKEIYDNCKSDQKPYFDNFLIKEIILYSYNYNSSKKNYKEFKGLIKKYGKSNKQIAEEIKEFVYNKENILYNHERCSINDVGEVKSKPQFYGYYSDYDWVVFCWLFGKMIDLPKGFPMFAFDLKQELDRKADSMTTMEITDAVYGKGYMKHDVYKYADKKYPEFNVTKVNSLLSAANYSHPELKQTNEHNALADARWNYRLYKFLNELN